MKYYNKYMASNVFCPKLKKRINDLNKIKIIANPRISVIITFYNEEKNIIRALNSIKNQTYKNIEIIAVNDKSTDNSLKIAQNYFKNNKIKGNVYNNDKNIGTYLSKNFALSKATGFLVTYLDGDDEFLPNKIETEIKILRETRKKCVFTRFKRNVNDENTSRLYSSPLIFRSVYSALGNFIGNRFGGDSEYWKRINFFVPGMTIEKKMVLYKAHYENNKIHITHKHKNLEREKFIDYYNKKHIEMRQKPDLLFNHIYSN